MLVYYNSRGCLFIHLLFALTAAPMGGRFKHSGFNSRYPLFPPQLVCESTTLVMSWEFRKRRFARLPKHLLSNNCWQFLTFFLMEGSFAFLQATEKLSWAKLLHSQTLSLWAEAWKNVCSNLFNFLFNVSHTVTFAYLLLKQYYYYLYYHTDRSNIFEILIIPKSKLLIIIKNMWCLTFTAVLPHAQVDLWDVITAAVAVWQLSHLEHILLYTCDVVPIVTQHPRQRGLLQLGELGWSEHAWVFIPEPE